MYISKSLFSPVFLLMFYISCLGFRYRKKDHNPNVGGLGLGFKEKISSSSQSGVTSSVPNQSTPPARGPATDRLSAMKAAFRTQYQNQVKAVYIYIIIG